MGSASSLPNKWSLEDCRTVVGEEYYLEFFSNSICDRKLYKQSC